MPVERHLEYLHQRRDHADVGDEPQETQVQVRQAGPGECATLQQVGIDEVVDRHRDRLDDDDGDAEAVSTRLDIARNVHIPRKKVRARFSTNAALMKRLKYCSITPPLCDELHVSGIRAFRPVAAGKTARPR